MLIYLAFGEPDRAKYDSSANQAPSAYLTEVAIYKLGLTHTLRILLYETLRVGEASRREGALGVLGVR